MRKIIAFDLDSTLAPIGQSTSHRTAELLQKLQKKAKICLCSGKPAYYLCGFARQLGLDKPILVGENGAVISLGYDLPPDTYELQVLPKHVIQNLETLRKIIKDHLGDFVWFQPNEVALTAFPRGKMAFDKLDQIVEHHHELLEGITAYRQCDCYDFSPYGISKKTGLDRMLVLIDQTPDDLIAVGDGVNDYCMFELASLSIGVNIPDESKVKINFKSIEQALEYLLTIL